MKIESSIIVATEEIIWLRGDGDEIPIQASIGKLYEQVGAWACPAALIGVDGRYPDIVGGSSMQALHLAMRLIRQRLEHLIEAGEVLVYLNDRNCRWDLNSPNT